ncbi:phosphoenolpyruvate--protein phosphotransferase [Desulfosarcina ovata]|uniref:Phosphoenolpyruvate-protein phosphotransferase n=1 Tax=Desulfosarcina ovata subsp. ovata TaxID=2752305 RepID=A0A5K8AE76_9BACT|nr:phosphoenolpyruvate--protein phosphotransferase [Desulfosarcina ovata]BBO90922.1 phosphoenolpyruvate-protein phosphotransferase [Desulfosarcina ovata subsp. ovata]
MEDQESQEIILNGIGGSPGICIGKAYLVDKEGVDVVKKYIVRESFLSAEVGRFKTAVKKARESLRQIIDNTPEELRQHAQILETHMLLFKDKMLYDRTIEVIEKERVNAEWALKKVVSLVKPMFENMTNDYLKQRAEDITHVADRIMENLVGGDHVNIARIDKRVILVARDLSPAETSQIQLERIKGFVTNRGGRASHTSIIARTLEIPAVLGVGNATLKINNDDIIIVDGGAGTVVVNPTEQTLLATEERRGQYEIHKALMVRNSYLPAETKNGQRISVMGNIELPEEVVSLLDHGGDGIGLYRTEFQYLSRPDFPSENSLFENYKDVIDVMGHRPVTIRTLDINGDKAVNYIRDNQEPNPALGLRAIRYCLRKPDIFQTQLRAILRAAAYGNVRILLPLISGIEEVEQAFEQIDEAAETLEKQGVVYKRDIPVGVMIEVPSAAVTADILAEKADFFSIGTNDLIQYTLAIDRGNRHVAHLHQPLHPAILRLIKGTCDAAKANGIPTYMCGEMAAEPIFAPILLGLGVNELSMNPQTIPVVKNAIRSIDTTGIDGFMEEMMRLTTPNAIQDLLAHQFGSVVPRIGLSEQER